MRNESFLPPRRRYRRSAPVVLAAVFLAVVSLALAPVSAGSLQINAWEFDRGNARVSENPGLYGDYRDQHPELMLIAGDKLPWVVEYDFELPVDATYTLNVRYASAGVRPAEILLDNKSVGKCCLKMTCNPPPYSDRHNPALVEGLPERTWDKHGAEWETVCKIPVTQGKHTLKLTRNGPPPNPITISLESPVAFPKDWKAPKRKLDLSRIPVRYRNVFLRADAVNIEALGLGAGGRLTPSRRRRLGANPFCRKDLEPDFSLPAKKTLATRLTTCYSDAYTGWVVHVGHVPAAYDTSFFTGDRVMRVSNVSFMSAAALVLLCLAPEVQAVPISIQNGSFEEAAGWKNNYADSPTFGTWYYNCVEIADVQADGIFNDSLATPPNLNNVGQPTGHGGAPRYWIGTGFGDARGCNDSRWGGVWNAWMAGPTDGRTSIIWDNRTPWGGDGKEGGLYQQLTGTVGDYKALGSSLVMWFDARYDGSKVDADGDDYLKAYFAVDGVQDVAGTWDTRFDGTANQKVHNWAGLPGGNPIPGYGAATKDDPARNLVGSVGPQNMETFSASLDLSGYSDASTISIVFANCRFLDAEFPNQPQSNRVYMDNVRVDAIPEPGTLALLGMALLGLGWYAWRKRR